MNEFGDMTAEDLERIEEQLEIHLEMITSLKKKADYLSFNRAQVLRRGGVEEIEVYGHGCVLVRIPREEVEEKDEVWARMHRLIQGRFTVPPVGSWVFLVCQKGRTAEMEYYGSDLAHPQGPLEIFPAGSRTPEEIGFGVAGNRVGGRRFFEASEDPDIQIMESGKEYLLEYDGKAKSLNLRSDTGCKTNVTSGNGGSVFVGSHDPASGAVGAGTDITVDAGESGTAKLSTGSGAMDLESTGGKITVKTLGSGDIDIKSSGGKLTLKAGSAASEAVLLARTYWQKLILYLTGDQAHIHLTPFGPTAPMVTFVHITNFKNSENETYSKNVENN